jgi:2-polyprenyl-3-methyl-5-hydroxy-6-metoxy-1,4-benzoquinol methylase
MNTAASTAYDAVAYPARCCPQAHPDRLATLATLFGMAPAPASRCRFLELGCSDGGNLLALAFALPGSAFVGVDYAPSAIARANEEARALGLTNVEFHCADLLGWDPPGGPFDYVIAHGLISWVPEAVRLRAFEICRDRLAAQGVVYVSYNALPGCHIRAVLREMMLFHTRHLADPAEKMAQAKAFLGLLLAGRAMNDSTELLKKEARSILERGPEADALLFHDDLAEINHPFYFHELAALAGQYGLQFLAEAEFSEMQDSIHPPPVAQALRQLGGDVVLKEQYLDFLKCRRFRRSLLCRDAVHRDREPKPGLMRHFLIASQAKSVSPSPDLSAGAAEGFSLSGATIQVDDPLTKAAMLELRAAWPRALPFGELVRAARSRLGRTAEVSQGDEDELAEAILTGYSAAVVELHLYQPAWEVRSRREEGSSSSLGGPVLSPLARIQLTNGREAVTTLRHTNLRVETPALRAAFLMLDGSQDAAAVAAELGRRIDAGGLDLPPGTTRQSLQADVAQAIRDAVAGGLCIGWVDTPGR